jgi:hypothetical protein
MQRRTTALVGLLAVAGLAFLIWKAGRPNKPQPELPPKPPVAATNSEQPQKPEEPKPAEEPAKPLTELDRVLAGGAVPPLPESAPKSVKFGVILFTYQGAQGAPLNAPPKDVAFKRAQSILPDAVANFADAAKKGDPGSIADAGRVSREVLEPALEYVLFTLEPGKVFNEPLDTPRGFWLLQRIQ